MGLRERIQNVISCWNGDNVEEDSTNDSDEDRIRPYSVLAAEVTPIRTDDLDTLRAARDEARDSLDKTIEAIEEKDDKAISTVRLSLVLIGLAITAASSVPSSLHYANWITIVGFLLLLCSTFVGIRTYTYTDYTPGVTSDYIEELDYEHYTEEEWLRWMNQRYQQWIKTAVRSDSIEATHLGRTHVLQIVAVALLILGAIAGLYGMERAPVIPSEPPSIQNSDNTDQPNQSRANQTTQTNDTAQKYPIPVSQSQGPPPQLSYTHKYNLPL